MIEALASSREQRETLGSLLAAKRKKLKITQLIAAERIGVTKGAYQAWELGKSMPDPSRFQMIAKYLGFGTTSELWEVLEGSVSPQEKGDRTYEALLKSVDTLTTGQLAELNSRIAAKYLEMA
jgi:transcriptional regulator with XRE-family HTH domain